MQQELLFLGAIVSIIVFMWIKYKERIDNPGELGPTSSERIGAEMQQENQEEKE